MAKKSVNDVFNDVKAKQRISKGKKPKPVHSHSRSDFESIAKAIINEPQFKIERAVANKEGGGYTVEEVYPVQGFRKMLQSVLRDFGVDKQESERVLTDAYEVRTTEGMYEFIESVIYTYLDAGRKFSFMSRPDFQGSISLVSVESGEKKTFRDVQTGESFNVERKAYKTLERKSPVHPWLSTRL